MTTRSHKFWLVATRGIDPWHAAIDEVRQQPYVSLVHHPPIDAWNPDDPLELKVDIHAPKREHVAALERVRGALRRHVTYAEA